MGKARGREVRINNPTENQQLQELEVGLIYEDAAGRWYLAISKTLAIGYRSRDSGVQQILIRVAKLQRSVPKATVSKILRRWKVGLEELDRITTEWLKPEQFRVSQGGRGRPRPQEPIQAPDDD